MWLRHPPHEWVAQPDFSFGSGESEFFQRTKIWIVWAYLNILKLSLQNDDFVCCLIEFSFWQSLFIFRTRYAFGLYAFNPWEKRFKFTVPTRVSLLTSKSPVRQPIGNDNRVSGYWYWLKFSPASTSFEPLEINITSIFELTRVQEACSRFFRSA